MKWLKLFENFNIDFEIKKEGNTYTVTAILPEGNVGSITFIYSYPDKLWYHFQGYMQEEVYEDIFGYKPLVYIEHVKVNKIYQKSGIGSKLLNFTLDWIKSNLDAKTIALNASPIEKQIPLTKLVEFYKKAGFKSIEQRGNNASMFKRI
jgi:GNAT superfamily N-acetyltransferase